jgi:hypothetical protein
MNMFCERCKKEIFAYKVCNYCKRKICNDCIKSSQRTSKISKLIICKDCWSDMRRRKAYKSRRVVSAVQKKS